MPSSVRIKDCSGTLRIPSAPSSSEIFGSRGADFGWLGRLRDLAQEQLLSTPLYFQEAQIAFLNTRADSLSRRLEKEIDRLAVVITETDSLKANALNSGI